MANASDQTTKVLLGCDIGIVTEPITRALRDHQDIEVISSSPDDVQLLIDFRRTKPDVVILDVGIGEKSLMALIRRLQRASDTVQIIMVGTLSFANVRSSMVGLVNGAAEFLVIPTAHGSANDRRDFQGKLSKVIRAIGQPSPAQKVQVQPQSGTPSPRAIKKPGALLIASSTGGPHAVTEVLSALPKSFPVPVLITQHMPPTFTKMFAGNLAKSTPFDAHEAADGQEIEAGTIYVAPGTHHMKFLRKGLGKTLVQLDDGPEVNYCKPSADPMIMSAVDIYGGNLLCVVLTGLGHDGRDGCKIARDAGARILAQDEESSVVWGMPGAVVNAGIADEVLPLSKIAARIIELVSR